MKSLFTKKVTGLLGILVLAMSLFTSCIPDPQIPSISYVNYYYTGDFTAGSTIYMDVVIANYGEADAYGVTGTLSTSSPYVDFTTPSHSYGSVYMSYYKNCSGTADTQKDNVDNLVASMPSRGFKFKIKSNCPDGTVINFTPKFEDSDGNSWEFIEYISIKVKNEAGKDNTEDTDKDTNKDTDDDTNKDNNKDTDQDTNKDKTGTIDKKFWGSWIQMDTGTEFYIDSEKVYKSSATTLKYSSVQTGIAGYSMDGTNVLVKGSTRYFRKGGGARSFTLNTSGFTDTAAKAIGLGKQQVTGRRTNKNNDSDKQTIKSEDDGKLKFTEAVAGDEQTVVITTEPVDGTSGGNKVNKVEIEVTPTYDGENLGTVPLVESGSYGFKTSYKVATDDPQGFCYGNYAQTYTVTAALTNIGSVDCAASAYTITCEDKNLALSGTLKGNFTTIEHGKSKDITFKVSYGALEKEYVDVPVKVSITDSKYLRTWDDYITLRFYKGLVNLNVKAYSPESKSSARLKGFLIYPDGRSKNFEVTHNSSKAITVPWSEQDYILAFSGATADSEMRFSCGFVSALELADLTGFWSAEEIGAYREATSTATAFSITDLKKPIKAYLGKGDVRFFKVNNKSVKLSYSAPVECVTGTFADSVSLSVKNNSDGKVNPGEDIYMDIKLHNTTKNAVNNVTCTIASTSKYVTIKSGSKDFGTINGSYYKTYNDKVASSTSTGYSSETSSSFASKIEAKNFPFYFSVSPECPIGEVIYITTSFKDSAGKSWTDDTQFKITVEKAVDPVKFVSHSLSDATTFSTNNNADGIINPGEVVYLDVKLKNQLTTTVNTLFATLSCSSKYVTISTISRLFGTITGGYYKTYYDVYKQDSTYGGSASEKSSLFSSLADTSYYAYKITVASDCPKDEVIKFSLSYEDSLNRTWKEDDVMSFTVGTNPNIATGITAVTDVITSDVVKITDTVDSVNNKIQFTATGCDSYVWYLDGVEQTETQIYTVDCSSTSVVAGVHEVMVVATKGTTKYSAQKQFTVIKNKIASEAGPVVPPSGSVILENDVWYDKDALSSTVTSKKYYFLVNKGKSYSVKWDDSAQGFGLYTCDIKVSGAYDTGTSLFTNINSGYNSPQTFIASKTCYVILTVQPYSTSSKSTGTYSIKYTEH